MTTTALETVLTPNSKDFNFYAIGEHLVTIGKEITKLNRNLDKVLDQLLEFENFETDEKSAIEAIQERDYEKALEQVKQLAKSHQKRADLIQQESDLRAQLEQARLQAQQIADGIIPDADKAESKPVADKPLASIE
ncbi:hypothetical protein [Reinekea sp. G2M2-21]|uniref:hypothetical protein n=1 Tax=Reinekea sp. G2M2-21 TaxID=2788942 RepID=UPI0018A9D714|nr:hypothetical protein [Reinekea sp. G2M2-21]